MTEIETSLEFIKYVFTEEEKRDIAMEMAQKVDALRIAEDEKKAIASEIKSQDRRASGGYQQCGNQAHQWVRNEK